MRKLLLLFVFAFPFIVNGQVVEEKIQIDTTSETIQVIYQPTETTQYYKKKIAVFADNPSQIAVEKTFTNSGQNGIYKVYYPTGRLKIKTVYANDKINGEWTWYDKKGIIIVKGIYGKGIKNGFWAYKSLKIYGKYKQGKRQGRWYFVNPNGKKVKSFYKNGELIKGEGFGNEQSIPVLNNDSIVNKGQVVVQEDQISKEYKQAISFLTENIVFRDAFKEHFAKGELKKMRELKKYYKNGKFQYTLMPTIINLSAEKFIKASKEDEIEVAKIDSSLKVNFTELENNFNNREVDGNGYLYDHSTFNGGKGEVDSEVSIYFSPVYNGLMRIDVVKFKEEVRISESNFTYERYNGALPEQKFQVLLYFENGVLKGAEYEKP